MSASDHVFWQPEMVDMVRRMVDTEAVIFPGVHPYGGALPGLFLSRTTPVCLAWCCSSMVRTCIRVPGRPSSETPTMVRHHQEGEETSYPSFESDVPNPRCG